MAANDLHPLERVLRERIVVLDGAMGTMIQHYKLPEAEYRGKRFGDWKGKDLKGSLELLNLTRPQVVEEIHTAYLEAAQTLSKRIRSAEQLSACMISCFKANL